MTEGLDYQGVRAGLEMAGIEVTPRLWGEMRVMERAVIGALNGRAT